MTKERSPHALLIGAQSSSRVGLMVPGSGGWLPSARSRPDAVDWPPIVREHPRTAQLDADTGAIVEMMSPPAFEPQWWWAGPGVTAPGGGGVPGGRP